MAQRQPVVDDSCGIAQALGVLSDPWSVLVLRDIARGHHRFEHLLAESGISRKVLAARLAALEADGVLERRAYSERPPRHEYLLTALGRAALPILAALQDWGDQWILGDGRPSATSDDRAPEVARVRSLVGTAVPVLSTLEPVGATPLTVLYCYPGSGVAGLSQVPGGVGCTLESCTYRDRLPEFEALGATVLGVSTQDTRDQAEFAQHNRIQFPLLSDVELELTTALRMPTVRVGGHPRLRRITLVISNDRVIRGVVYPISDVTGAVEDSLSLVRSLQDLSQTA